MRPVGNWIAWLLYMHRCQEMIADWQAENVPQGED